MQTFGQVSPAPTPEPNSGGPIGGQYGNTYAGEATYYGFSTGGNCAYKGTVGDLYPDMIPSEESMTGEGERLRHMFSM